MWAKHTNFEVDTHAPLILRVPGMRNRGSRTPALVEFIDIYPSLCELAGLAIPGQLPGRSFVPLIDDPQLPWKNAAFSQYPRGDMMGYSMRTDQYRFTKWRKKGQPSEIVAYELYDLHSDPHGFVNIAPQAESKKVIERLSRIMKDAGIGDQHIP
jgi:arylsulfatase A-like enzyme